MKAEGINTNAIVAPLVMLFARQNSYRSQKYQFELSFSIANCSIRKRGH